MEYVKWLIHILLPLLLGIAIYSLYRENSFFYMKGFNLKTNSIIKYNLPDGLWQYSFSSSIILIWKNDSSKYRLIWFGIASMIGIIAETMQYLKVLPGTFDPVDILFLVIGTLLPFVLLKQTKHEK